MDCMDREVIMAFGKVALAVGIQFDVPILRWTYCTKQWDI